MGEGQEVIATSDGGDTWTVLADIPNNVYLDIFFTNLTDGWVCGKYGAVLTTNNGGISWEAQQSGTQSDIECIVFTGNGLGWAAGDAGTILFTENYGNVWQPVPGGTNLHLESITLLNENKAWIAGENGTVLHRSGLISGFGDEIASAAGQMNGHPNPFNGVFSITADAGAGGRLTLEVFTVTGQRVHSGDYRARDGGMLTIQVDGRNWQRGIYICTLLAEGRKGVLKMIKQ